jgi:hypothetical protein
MVAPVLCVIAQNHDPALCIEAKDHDFELFHIFKKFQKMLYHAT